MAQVSIIIILFFISCFFGYLLVTQKPKKDSSKFGLELKQDFVDLINSRINKNKSTGKILAVTDNKGNCWSVLNCNYRFLTIQYAEPVYRHSYGKVTYDTSDSEIKVISASEAFEQGMVGEDVIKESSLYVVISRQEYEDLKTKAETVKKSVDELEQYLNA